MALERNREVRYYNRSRSEGNPITICIWLITANQLSNRLVKIASSTTSRTKYNSILSSHSQQASWILNTDQEILVSTIVARITWIYERKTHYGPMQAQHCRSGPSWVFLPFQLSAPSSSLRSSRNCRQYRMSNISSSDLNVISPQDFWPILANRSFLSH